MTTEFSLISDHKDSQMIEPRTHASSWNTRWAAKSRRKNST